VVTRKKKATDRKTRVIVETPDQDEESLIPEAAIAKSQEEEDVEELLTSFPQESKVELWKWDDPEHDEWNYAGRYTIHGWSLDVVSREHGKGKYRVVVRGPKTGDDGRTRIVQLARRHFAVAGPRGVPAEQSGGLGGISMVDMFKMNMDLMRTMMTQPREPMADLVRAIHDLNKPTTDPMQTAIQLVTLLKDDSKKGEFGEMLEVLNTGIQLAEGRGEGDGLASFGRAFASLLEKMPSDKGPPQVATIAPAALPSPEMMNREFFLMSSRFLGRAADRDGDIELYADWIVDQVEALPSLHPMVQQWFLDPSYPEPVLPLFPGVKPTWLRGVLLRARDIATGMEEEPDVEVEPDGSDGPADPPPLH
jgi:hypothetical protein